MIKKETQEGITLISLVITVIILLILALVAINLAIDSNGLFGKAGDAANKWNSSVAEEQTILQGLFEHAGIETPTEENNPVEYIWELDEDGKITNGTVTLERGDFVNYNPTEGVADDKLLTYSSPLDCHGSTSVPENEDGERPQTFSAGDYQGGWRVLDTTSDGKIRLISANTIKPNGLDGYWLGGGYPYEHACTELENICDIFGHGFGAESASTLTYDEISVFQESFEPESATYDAVFRDQEGKSKEYWIPKVERTIDPWEQAIDVFCVQGESLCRVTVGSQDLLECDPGMCRGVTAVVTLRQDTKIVSDGHGGWRLN